MEKPLDHEDLLWQMRGLRAKRSKRHSSPLPHPNADEIAAAEALILLAEYGGGFCSAAIDAAPAVSPPKKHQELSHSAAVAAVEIEAAAADVLKKQEAASPDTPLLNINHHCWLCGKVFHSFQALSGHMTSHRVNAAAVAVPDDPGRRSSAAKDSGRVHECSYCHQQFATGQALGGHKRKHYEGPPLARKAVKSNSTSSPNRLAGDSGGESSDGGGATSHARPVIDLNLPPPPE